METSTENTPSCPTCGQPRSEGHVCPPSDAGAGHDSAFGTPSGSAEETARIQIPEALRNTGLFRAAWKPTSETNEAPATGSIFARAQELDGEVSAAPAEPLNTDPFAGLDLTFSATDDDADPWADLTVPTPVTPEPEAAEPVTPEPVVDEPVAPEPDEFERDPRLDPEHDDLFGDPAPDLTTNEEPEPEPEPEPAPAHDPLFGLSPIAAAEAAARAATPAPDAGSEPAPALDETAAFDLEQAFADEAAAHEALEPVPTPEQSAYDLYGDSLYAPQESEAPDAATPAQGTSLGQPTQASPYSPYSPATDATALAAPVPGSDPAVDPASPFATRLSTAAVTSASLPSSVPFAPGNTDGDEAETAAAAGTANKPRRTAALVAAVLAVVLVAGGGAWWWTAQQDAPVKDAFATSHDSFLAASGRLDRAASIEDVAAAGAAFEQSIRALNATAAEARESGSALATSARRATLAETAVAEAAAPLKDLSTDDLSPWTSAKAPLKTALDGLADVRTDVQEAGGGADALPSSDVVAQVQDVIAAEVVQGAAATVVDLGAKLESASLLADVRAVGASAGEYVSALGEAVSGIEDAEQRDDLSSVVAFHYALSGLSTLRPATIDTWEMLGKNASTAVDELPSGKDEAKAGLKAADALVEEASSKLEAWETKHAAAKQKKASDAAALTSAVSAVEAADETYSTLYGGLEALVNEVTALPAEGTQGAAFQRLDAAATAREQLVTQLSGFTLVPNSAKRLESLVAALRSDAEAVRAAATAAGECVDSCRLASTPAVSDLGTVTAETATAWNEAMDAWESTTTAAVEKIADRSLPKRPKI